MTPTQDGVVQKTQTTTIQSYYPLGTTTGIPYASTLHNMTFECLLLELEEQDLLDFKQFKNYHHPVLNSAYTPLLLQQMSLTQSEEEVELTPPKTTDETIEETEEDSLPDLTTSKNPKKTKGFKIKFQTS